MTVRSVEEGFGDFDSAISVRQMPDDSLASYLTDIEVSLSPVFNPVRFLRVGSLENGTGIERYSKRDLLLISSAFKNVSDLNSALEDVQILLADRFGGVTADSHSVHIPLEGAAGNCVVIIPAVYSGQTAQGHVSYGILDLKTGLRSISPEAFDGYLTFLDLQLEQKVRRLIKYIKAWKYFRRVPIASFYLAAHILRYSAGRSELVYSLAIRNIFEVLRESGLGSIEDPVQVTEDIEACTGADLDDAMKKIDIALTRAEQACKTESDGDIDRAFHWWGMLFDGKFPSCYELRSSDHTTAMA